MLIKSLVDNHCAEAKMLREQLLNQERQKRDCEQLMVNLEIELNQFKDDSKNHLNQSEFDEIQARSIEANAQRLQQMHAKYTEECKQLKDVILQLEDHINNLQTAKSEADQKFIISQNAQEENIKEVAILKQQLSKQKDSEDALKKQHKLQLDRERKAAD